MTRRLRSERGMTTIQVAILFPAVLLWLMLIVQYGLWWHAKQVANAAAAEAVDAAQVSDGSAAEGEAWRPEELRALIDEFREALRSRGSIALDEERFGDAAALSGVSRFVARDSGRSGR